MTATKSSAVVPATLTHEELMGVLGGSGQLQAAGNFRRMSLQGGMLKTDPGQPNEESWPPVKGNKPVMVVRIVKPPIYFNAFYLRADELNGAINPALIARPDLEGKFAKKYDDPSEQANDPWANLDAYLAIEDKLERRGAFKADIQLQIMPENGEFTGTEPIFTFTMSGTAALDWRGTRANPAGGIVQEKNFIVQLAELAAAQAAEAGLGKDEQALAVLRAQEQLKMGGVIAEIRLISHTDDKNNTWVIPAFSPIYINDLDETPALAASTDEDAGDDIPF